MAASRQGSFHLFRLAGIDVFLHWSWFLVAAYEIQTRKGSYSSISWNILEYVGLFLIVLMHEFGHSLACRQVGGLADTIVLWPMGGIAYVDPPPRPGPTLWAIAAGPLVNVALYPVIWILAVQARFLPHQFDLSHLLVSLQKIDFWLLVFNILPVYPLDGGKILRSLLWFVLGRARSLMTAAIIGLMGVAAFIALAIYDQDAWLGFIAIYMATNCWSGFKQAQALSQLDKLPRRNVYTCPTCKSHPPIGEYWKCSTCGQAFDTFATGAVCPKCSTRFPTTRCIDCGRQNPLTEWMGQTILVSNPVFK